MTKECQLCLGTGKCPACGGSGIFERQPDIEPSGDTACNICAGDGICPECRGSGLDEEKEND